MLQRARSSSVSTYFIIGIIVVVIIGGGIAAYFLLAKGNPGKKPTAVTNPAKAPAPPGIDRSTIDYTNPDLGIAMIVPAYWKANKTSPTFTTLSAKDGVLAVSIDISQNGGNHAPCGYAIETSEQIQYARPLPGQRTQTYLSILGDKEEPTKLCALMISGPKQFTKGDLFNTVSPDPNLAAQLPTDQIYATFILADDPTKHPEKSVVQASKLYEEVVAALKSLQIK